ncbi:MULTISPECIES: DNA topoisomerase III [Thiorhodovibrio]|uniref:DNA topoisomerase III n=1 Tax=Thiorhodovibrio TaxID=61593 RepID=UPI0019124B0A|nr:MULTISPECIES: DNA topoisomerase III [Thiorhodovibrio]MBK5970834.1 DNA topoisomerase III [Thiorhodovibrio winogradskyi]WPL10774.1 DNA topoisomerase 3 [Thiorhodovibrio litoralis]
MTTLVLAEKPSVARDIARVLGARSRHEGYLEGSGYRVTWALGHLVHFAEPDDYGTRRGTPGETAQQATARGQTNAEDGAQSGAQWQPQSDPQSQPAATASWAGRWSLAQLPMIPARWRLRTDKKTAAQFKIVKALLNAHETERVICATDAGREGEAIFRLIYQHARCTKPVERLWISSLTDEAIRAGFQALKPGSAFDPLAATARARAQADWLIGMNLTRAYTVRNRVLCTIGRVQTPTLAMIVARDAAIAAFEKAYFYELVAHLREGFDARLAPNWPHDGETRIDDKAKAEKLREQLAPHQSGQVTDIQRKERRQRPPPLYDLTNLQRDANRHFGFTAAKTLELAQQLYEQHKLISYPRTESRHISEDMLPQLPGILGALNHPLAPIAAERLATGHKLSKAYVDKTRLTDHHAILPTQTRAPASLPEPLQRIYDLVCARFVAVFLPEQRVLDIHVRLDIGGACFVAQAARVLDPGWKAAEVKSKRSASEPETESAQTTALAALEKGQSVHVAGMEVVEKETQAPRPYDDASLLNAMKNAGREIEDDALAAAMKDSGLGTPATRAEIIEKLIRTGYVERQRKTLRATEKGRVLIDLVAEPLRSPELTADWEQRLKAIERAEADAGAFYQDICDFIRALIPQVAVGATMSPEQIDAARAAAPGKTGSKKGGKSTRGKGRSKRATQSAGDLGACPICKEGQISENSRAFGCSGYRDGCGFTVWKTIAGHKVTEAELKALVDTGHSEPISDFRSKAGKAFSARLQLDQNGRVALDFDSAADTDQVTRAPIEPAPISAPQTASTPTGIAQCPKCHQGRIIRGRRGYGCDRYREGCDLVIWREQYGIILDEHQIRRLIERGQTDPIDRLTRPDGQTGHGILRLRADFSLEAIAQPDPEPFDASA